MLHISAEQLRQQSKTFDSLTTLTEQTLKQVKTSISLTHTISLIEQIKRKSMAGIIILFISKDACFKYLPMHIIHVYVQVKILQDRAKEKSRAVLRANQERALVGKRRTFSNSCAGLVNAII